MRRMIKGRILLMVRDSDKDEQFAENFEDDDEGVMSYT